MQVRARACMHAHTHKDIKNPHPFPFPESLSGSVLSQIQTFEQPEIFL